MAFLDITLISHVNRQLQNTILAADALAHPSVWSRIGSKVILVLF